MNALANAIFQLGYEEVAPMSFYRDIFPSGELDIWRENPSERKENEPRYTAIAIEITNQHKQGRPLVKRYTITDDLDEIDGLMYSNNFCVMSPISYIGKSRKSLNARYMYALCVEIDGIIYSQKKKSYDGLYALINQWQTDWIPIPTYLVASGTGLHLYYLWEKPIPLFQNVVKSLDKYKRVLTDKLWNYHVTYYNTVDSIQYESIFQGFRMVGTITKKGDRVYAYRVGERVSIDYMNKFLLDRERDKAIVQIYKSNLTLAQAKAKYPRWYEDRIVKKKAKGGWTCKRDLYDWWKRRIMTEAHVGHRYYCMMSLCIYAIKCDIDQAELERDCFELMDIFEAKTDSETNHFTEKDVIDALQSFEDKGLITYPRNSISFKSGLKIEANKRNYREQKLHLKIARAHKSILKEAGELQNDGRPSAEPIVQQWQLENPQGTKAQCIRETKLSKSTVYKHWNSGGIL